MLMYMLPLALLATSALAEPDEASVPFGGDLYVAPGRANRLQKRAGADFGVLKFNCKGGEAACNNACYYINCQAQAHNIKDADKIVYTGPNSKDNDQNRRESGCQARHPQKPHDSVTSVCQAFPYSQVLIPSDKQSQALDWQCDEWPPASSQQQPFGSQGRAANSLRCMPGAENRALGSQLAAFYLGRGNFPGRKGKGAMARDDYAHVEFDVSNADKSKVPFCIKNAGTYNCGNDGYQFGMTRKDLKDGKISAPIAPNAKDNLYALQNTVYKDILQCSVKFTRDGDKDFKDVVLSDADDKDHKAADCNISGGTGDCTLKGLPKDLKLSKTGALGSVIKFEYAPGEKNANINWFAWDTDSKGTGKGPATNDGDSESYCKKAKNGNKEDVECWFPCYKSKDGR
ncbi:deoxyribonuclease nucA/NucB domain-containing protein [Pochonia chlamydosporia 170]|uniref:Deoxyribonuclease nucA/NucB domain-containing protein n=1 Tax=Pochonia chlamydosporia 170 TaxID=1380566 RepID=A0A179FIU4_METCM|nr:deoxyribonuclease nucA/NucB domain-containing protein [Pochonia chlamydosporia 170]OAQ65218.1 deoxyribonuclease nucA/NucB domain-containing protein [Pochonia chlamydosporia 170]